MIMRLLFSTVVAFVVTAGLSQAFAQASAPARQQAALLIGNAKYPDSETPLKEPLNDVKALAEELRRQGFDVEVGENLSKDAMQRVLTRFYGKLTAGSVAMVFFSGYGIQSNRQTYMLPVDGQFWTEADVRRDGFSLDAALAEINAKGAKVKIALLDASRRNPYERRFRSFSAGLAPVVAPTGTLVMYSAAPGAVVNDSATDRGVFASELVKQIAAQGANAEEVFNRTRIAVSRATRSEQVPWFSSSLGEDFAFGRPGATGPAIAAAPPAATPAPAVAPVPTPAPAVNASRPPVPAVPAPSPTAPAKVTTDDPVLKDLEARITANPRDAAAYYRRGQVYASRGDFPPALKDFDEAIKLNPKDSEALNNRCWTKAMVGDLNGALRDCNEALQIRPQYADALDSRGFINLKLGMPSYAVTDYDAALKLSPNSASALYGRGLAKARSGNQADGDKDMAAARALKAGIADEFARYGLR
jgi:cytochrome c-type biogenesis protein CcmH/NrfG